MMNIPSRDQIADVLAHHPACNLKDEGYSVEDVLRMADAVIAALPEFRRIEQVRQVCEATLKLEQGPYSNRAWLAQTVLNVLDGQVDDQ